MNQSSYNTGSDQYYDQGTQDVSMEETPQHASENGDSEGAKKKRPWEKFGPDGRIIKKKPNPARKNAIFRKALQPKSPIMCLNELQSGLKYVMDPVSSIGNYSVSVEVNGQNFRGYGSTKDLAKQASAEAALVSFVKPPPPKPAPGETPDIEADTTPWRTIASFAMYKLFNDWRDGRIGMSTMSGQHGFVPGMQSSGNMAMVMQNMQSMQGMTALQPQAGATPSTTPAVKEDSIYSNVGLHLTRGVGSTPKTPADNASGTEQSGDDSAKASNKPPREVKLNTESQRAGHPVMILHQLCRLIKYDSCSNVDPVSNSKKFVVNAVINDQEFTGEGNNIKAAKFQLAKTALKVLFGIENVFELP